MGIYFEIEEMKLFKLVAIVSSSVASDPTEWQQPTYWNALASAKSRISGWGHPVGVKAAAMWSSCPTLETPLGVKEIICDQATCMSVCEDGKTAIGRRRIKCRWKRKKGFFWKQQLSECKGCDPVPAMIDSNTQIDCGIGNRKKEICSVRCGSSVVQNTTDFVWYNEQEGLHATYMPLTVRPASGTILGMQQFIMRCKCPRNG